MILPVPERPNFARRRPIQSRNKGTIPALATLPQQEGIPAFHSRDISARRYVWDPVVHKTLYGEDLSFFLLRLSAPTLGVVADLEAVLRRASIVSSCVYTVFGFYDALLRVWCTPEQRLRLIDELQNEFPDADFIREFRVDKAYYEDWSAHRHDLTFRTLQSFTGSIEAASGGATGKQDIPAALELLTKEGLLHVLDPLKEFPAGIEGDQLIKLYFALSSTAFHVTALEPDVVRAAVSEVDILRAKSVYTGDGFCDYLVKGMVARYRDVDRAAIQLQEAIERRRLAFRTMTLLIANQDAPESDFIDVSHVDVGRSLMRLVRTLGGGTILNDLEALSESRRQDVRSVFDEFAPSLLDTAFERFFLGILEAGIRSDILMLGEKLSFITRLEALLRQFATSELWPPHLGSAWPQRVLAVANDLRREGKQRADIPGLTDPAQFTLSDYVRVTDKLVAVGEIEGPAVADRLGPDWRPSLHGILGLRNDVAHGNLYEPAKSVRIFNQWRDVARSACRAGDVYNRLVDASST